MIASLFARVGFTPNDTQRAAIEHLDGPLFLLAGCRFIPQAEAT